MKTSVRLFVRRAVSEYARSTSYDSAFDNLPAVLTTNPGQSRKLPDACDPSRRACAANGYRKSQRPLERLPVAFEDF